MLPLWGLEQIAWTRPLSPSRSACPTRRPTSVLPFKGHFQLRASSDQLFLARIQRLRERDSRMSGVSMGYAYYDAAASNIRDVIQEADTMLYRNKTRQSE